MALQEADVLLYPTAIGWSLEDNQVDQQRQCLVADLSLTRTEHVRRSWPFSRDRRIDAYGDLTKRFCDK